MNNFKVITITHKTANINHIGQYIPTNNTNPTALCSTLHHIKEQLHIDELFYLATCNRLTFILVQEAPVTDAYLLHFFSKLHADIPKHCLLGMLDVVALYSGEEAVRHIFEVACSIDSLVVGEREIIRQLREAYNFSSQNQLTGDNIRLLIETAIPLAKYVYTHTQISQNNVSVVSLAMKSLMNEVVNANSRFLIIGAGQTNNLVAKFLVKFGFKNFAVFNRSLDKAQQLAQYLHGEAHALSTLKSYKGGFDVIITCTGASEPIITPKLYQQLLQNDPTTSHERKIIIDLAVPTDTNPSILRQHNIKFIAVEELRVLAEKNLQLRKKEIFAAQKIVLEKVENFKVELRKRRVERGLKTIPEEIQKVKSKALNTVFRKDIADLDDNALALLERVVNYMESKYIAIPMRVAKSVLVTELQTETEEDVQSVRL